MCLCVCTGACVFTFRCTCSTQLLKVIVLLEVESNIGTPCWSVVVAGTSWHWCPDHLRAVQIYPSKELLPCQLATLHSHTFIGVARLALVHFAPSPKMQ